MIIDIRTVSFESIDPKITTVGWTILPVFSADGYI